MKLSNFISSAMLALLTTVNLSGNFSFINLTKECTQEEKERFATAIDSIEKPKILVIGESLSELSASKPLERFSKQNENYTYVFFDPTYTQERMRHTGNIGIQGSIKRLQQLAEFSDKVQFVYIIDDPDVLSGIPKYSDFQFDGRTTFERLQMLNHFLSDGGAITTTLKTLGTLSTDELEILEESFDFCILRKMFLIAPFDLDKPGMDLPYFFPSMIGEIQERSLSRYPPLRVSSNDWEWQERKAFLNMSTASQKAWETWKTPIQDRKKLSFFITIPKEDIATVREYIAPMLERMHTRKDLSEHCHWIYWQKENKRDFWKSVLMNTPILLIKK